MAIRVGDVKLDSVHGLVWSCGCADLFKCPLIGANPPYSNRFCFIVIQVAWADTLFKMCRSRVGGSFSLGIGHHIVWPTKCRYKGLKGDIRLPVGDICRQVFREKGADFILRVLLSGHVHMFVLMPPKLAVTDLVRLMQALAPKRCSVRSESSRNVIGAAVWERRPFWTTNDAITEDIVLQYLQQHFANPTGTSR